VQHHLQCLLPYWLLRCARDHMVEVGAIAAAGVAMVVVAMVTVMVDYRGGDWGVAVAMEALRKGRALEGEEGARYVAEDHALLLL